MRVYLDDDLDANTLVHLLQRAGHDVTSPRVVGTRGRTDADHLVYAAAHRLVLLTANAEDFLALHLEWRGQNRPHPGILVVYRENNPARDMSFQQITDALTHIEESAIPLENACHNLNRWRPRVD